MKKDRPMFANDMFWKGIQQVFSVRAGDFIGYHQPGEIQQAKTGPEPKIVEVKVENQLKIEL